MLLPPTRCDVPLAEAGKPRFPVDAWMASGAQGWLVVGADAVRARRAPRREAAPRVEALAERPRDRGDARGGRHARRRSRAASSCSARRRGSSPSSRRGRRRRTRRTCATFIDRFGVRPSYWTALGRDAGALAGAALAPLPADATSEPKAVTQRRAIVQAGLLGARAPLVDDGRQGHRRRTASCRERCASRRGRRSERGARRRHGACAGRSS